MWKIYAAFETSPLIGEADRVLYHFVMFLLVFFTKSIQNEIQLLSKFFCYSWLACLLGCG